MPSRRFRAVVLTLTIALIVGSNSGCDLLALLFGDGAGFPIPGLGTSSVGVVVVNESGVDARVEARFFFSDEDVRVSDRVLQAEGLGSSLALLQTVAEEISVIATIESNDGAASPLFQTGAVLLNVTLRLGVDYNGGDTITLVIPGPGEDCDLNGQPDDEQIAGGAADCNENGQPDVCELDNDDDGVIDACDNCPADANADQEDDNNDGVGNACTPGACLQSDGCTIVTAAECASLGGSFQGPGTNCPSIGDPDPMGACCKADGSCEFLTLADCDEIEGSYQGDNALCEDADCPQPAGACCLPNGDCVNATELSCTTQDGTYQGDNTNCETAECPQPTGACCFGESCSDLTLSECNSFEGSYQGDGTSCDDEIDPCFVPVGACCLIPGFGDGTGNNGLTRGDVSGPGCLELEEVDCVEFFNGSFQGGGTTCFDQPDPCAPPPGACCFPNGTCSEEEVFNCQKSGGTFQGFGVLCSEVSCPQPVGACCLPNGECASKTEVSCTTDGGTYQGDFTDCSSTMCPQPTGACCMFDGTCANLTETSCNFDKGSYQGDFTDCSSTMCPQPTGACCIFDGTCENLTETSCNFDKGSYQGDFTDCKSTSCPQPLGACCLPNGECSNATETSCNDNGGAYEGDFTDCAGTACPEPTGACCQAGDGLFCTVETAVNCDGFGGEYLGDGTTCADAPCDAIAGACCFFGEFCEPLTPELCVTEEGEFLGIGISCDDCFPTTGACCDSKDFCAQLTENDCSAIDGTYYGDDSVCDGKICFTEPTGACCDGSEGLFCYETTQFDCEEFGDQWLGTGISCDEAPCDALAGACCFGGGIFCNILTEALCLSQDGSFIGIGTDCALDCLPMIEVQASTPQNYVYENLPAGTNCTVSLNALVAGDTLNNNSYSYSWEIAAPADRPNAMFAAVSGETTGNAVFRAPLRPAYSPGGMTYIATVTVTGDDFGNIGTATVPITVRVLGDVNGDGCTNSTDVAIIAAVVDGEVTDPATITAADINCDGANSAADQQIAVSVANNFDGNGAGGACTP